MSTAAKSFITIFLFLLFLMCNCAVNWCDKLCFLHLCMEEPLMAIYIHKAIITNLKFL